MKKKCLLIFAMLSTYALQTAPIVYLQFRPYTQDPHTKRHHRHLKNEEKKTIGVVATYAGNVETSDLESDISFPRKHVEDRLQLIVTPKITPIIRQNKLISHWEIESKKHTKLYNFTLTADDKGNINWLVQETTMPEDKIVPIDSVIIIANAKNVYVPTGTIKTTQSKNLNIPPIFIKRTFRTNNNALFVTNLNFLLGQLTPVDSQTGKTLARQQVTTE